MSNIKGIVNKILEGADVRESLSNFNGVVLTVRQFVLSEMAGNTIFSLVDTTQRGWAGAPSEFILYGGDKNAIVNTDYADFLVVGYDPYKAHKMFVFIKPNK